MIESFIFRHAVREFLMLRRVLPWLLLSLGAFALAYYWESLSPNSTQAEQYANVSSMIVFRMVALASAIFTTSIISQEVEQKTIVYLLTRPVPRWKLLLARFAASALVVALLGIFGSFVVSIGVYGFAGAFGNPLFVSDLLAIVLGALAYGGLFLFISLIINRAMIVCLLFAFGWETMVPNMPGEQLARLSIFSHMQAIAEHPSSGSKVLNFFAGDLGTNLITRGDAVPVLILVAAVALGVASWWFTRFEYVPREDAE
jgi:ABC-2 type transport system permease protein